MDTIDQNQLWSFFDGSSKAIPWKGPKNEANTAIRKARPHHVRTFLELATKVAELQFWNRDYVLLFRGQPREYMNRSKNTSLKPKLLRPGGEAFGDPLPKLLEKRFEILEKAEAELVSLYRSANFENIERLQRHQILRWAILQHYEVCDTPLLDVTQSLRIAASFAWLPRAREEAIVYVLGVPNLSGAITASAEAGLQIVRLSSVCPPSAVRPHIQEGYLLGEYPELSSFDRKKSYPSYEIDFGRRLIAKFKYEPGSFWKTNTFPRVKKQDLYPSADSDPLFKLAQKVEQTLGRKNHDGHAM